MYYAVTKEFLEGLGFSDFDSISGRKTNIFWDRDFIIDQIRKGYSEFDMEIGDDLAESSADVVEEKMRKIDYSDINETISWIIKDEICL